MKHVTMIAILAGFLIIASALRASQMAAPRGIRYANPGNLRPLSSGVWDGQTGTKDGYCVFGSAAWGLRAASRNLLSYGTKHGITSIRGVANRWAPKAENDPDQYATTLAKVSGLDVDAYVNLAKADINGLILKGIVRAENGQKFPGVDWFSDSEIHSAVLAAGVKP